jgi:hypothetical protein
MTCIAKIAKVSDVRNAVAATYAWVFGSSCIAAESRFENRLDMMQTPPPPGYPSNELTGLRSTGHGAGSRLRTVAPLTDPSVLNRLGLGVLLLGLPR